MKQLLKIIKTVHDKMVWWCLSFLVTVWAVHMMFNYLGWFIRHPRSKGQGWEIQSAMWYDTFVCLSVIGTIVYGLYTCVMIIL